MSLKKILERTREYLWIPSVVRFEQPFMECLADDFNVFGYDVDLQDRFLVVTKHGSKSPKILTAHIDRHGIVFNKNQEYEYAAFNAKKHYGDENKVSEAVFKKAGKRFVSERVFVYDQFGINLEEGIVRSFSYDFDKKNLFFDVSGPSPIRFWDGVAPMAYAPPYQLVENGKVSGQIDNAISVAVARQLVEDGFDGRVILATEEEIGRSWKHITDYLSSLDSSKEIVTLDITPYDDERAINEGLVVLRNKDQKGEFNGDLVGRLRAVCERESIKYEMKDETIEAENAKLPEDKHKKLGITELGRIVEHTKGKFNGAIVQLPLMNYHTNHETTSELAVKNYYEALLKVL